MTNKTHVLHIRLTVEEYAAYSKCVEEIGETLSRFTRKLIREAVNNELDLITAEQSVLKVAIRQLIGIANNLNQITTAIHSGTTHQSVDEKFIVELRKYVYEVKQELVAAIKKTTKRWVRGYEQ
jgi:hypothetical protein